MNFGIFVAAATVLVSAQGARASTPVRTSNLNQDILISQSLYNALKTSVGKIPQITASGSSVVLAANLDQLTCTASSCALNWDTTSATYPQDAGVFSQALYGALGAWATSSAGANDPAVHRFTYPQTGSVEIDVAEGDGSTDEVDCSDIINGLGDSTIDCSFVVSDYSEGTTADLQALYAKFLAAPSYIQGQTQALLATVSTSQFATPGKPGRIESLHTLYTDLLDDGYQVTAYYVYVKPIVDSSGTIVSEGITLALMGSEFESSGTASLGAVQAASYVLPAPIPPNAVPLLKQARAARTARRARAGL